MKRLHPASSVILAARNVLQQCLTILALKRSSQMKNFPKAYVFPGGHVDAADEHVDWLSIVPSIECDVNLKIFNSKQPAQNSGKVSKEVSYRIAAIRETFEECGILLCRRSGADDESIFQSPDDLNVWRTKVHEDAYEFLNLCRARRCFPNLKALSLLSNWISPCHFAKRFDTAFFLTTLDNEIEVKADDTETESVEWKRAKDFSENVDIFLAPPQVYEFARLDNFNDLEGIEKFAREVDARGCHRITPVLVNMLDGDVFLLPGDQRYEEFFDENVERPVKLNYDVLSFRSDIMHRVEYRKLPNNTSQREVLIQNLHCV